MKQTLLKLIRLDIANRCQVHGQVVQWRRAEAYGVDSDKLQKHAEDLAADSKEAEDKILVPVGYFDEGLPTQSDEPRTVFPTVLCSENLDEDSECLQ